MFTEQLQEPKAIFLGYFEQILQSAVWHRGLPASIKSPTMANGDTFEGVTSIMEQSRFSMHEKCNHSLSFTTEAIPDR